jgi:hypothetical protein
MDSAPRSISTQNPLAQALDEATAQQHEGTSSGRLSPQPSRSPSRARTPSSPPIKLDMDAHDAHADLVRPKPLAISIGDAPVVVGKKKSGSPHVGLKTTSRPSSPSVTVAMEVPQPLKRTPTHVSPQAAAAAAAGAALRHSSSSHAEDSGERNGHSPPRNNRHRPAQISREFKDEVITYLDSAGGGDGLEEEDQRLFHHPTSPSNGKAQRSGKARTTNR